MPLSQRNLPASFWNSEYQYPAAAAAASAASLSSLTAAAGHAALAAGHADLYAAASAGHDPYGNSLLQAASNDPWQNYMAAAASGGAAAAYSAHRHASDMYSAARLNPQSYSSLFLQSSAAGLRQGRKGEAAAAGGWGAAAAAAGAHSAAAAGALDGYGASTHSHYSAMTGEPGI